MLMENGSKILRPLLFISPISPKNDGIVFGKSVDHFWMGFWPNWEILYFLGLFEPFSGGMGGLPLGRSFSVEFSGVVFCGVGRRLTACRQKAPEGCLGSHCNSPDTWRAVEAAYFRDTTLLD